MHNMHVIISRISYSLLPLVRECCMFENLHVRLDFFRSNKVHLKSGTCFRKSYFCHPYKLAVLN